MPQYLTSFVFEVHECIFPDASLQPLPDRLHQDLPGLSNLELRFHYAKQLTGATVEHLANHLPPNLTSLALDLRACEHLTDASLQQLFSALHRDLPALSHLKLDLSHFTCGVTDASLHHLAENLSAGLTSLKLNFDSDKNITDPSVQDLARHLPPGLTYLRLNLAECQNITDASVQQLASSLAGLRQLISLRLDFQYSKVSRASLQDLANHLPQRHQIQLVLNGKVQEFGR